MIIDEARTKLFWNKVNIAGDDDCWLWTAYKDKDGYGRFWADKPVGAHVFSWQLENGDIQPGLMVRHKCHISNCVNPQHLIPGTGKDNSADAIAAGRHAHGSRHGRAKLNENKVRDIRKLSSVMSNSSIAELYNVSYRLILDIVKRKLWKHIE